MMLHVVGPCFSRPCQASLHFPPSRMVFGTSDGGMTRFWGRPFRLVVDHHFHHGETTNQTSTAVIPFVEKLCSSPVVLCQYMSHVSIQLAVRRSEGIQQLKHRIIIQHPCFHHIIVVTPSVPGPKSWPWTKINASAVV